MAKSPSLLSNIIPFVLAPLVFSESEFLLTVPQTYFCASSSIIISKFIMKIQLLCYFGIIITLGCSYWFFAFLKTKWIFNLACFKHRQSYLNTQNSQQSVCCLNVWTLSLTPGWTCPHATGPPPRFLCRSLVVQCPESELIRLNSCSPCLLICQGHQPSARPPSMDSRFLSYFPFLHNLLIL